MKRSHLLVKALLVTVSLSAYSAIPAQAGAFEGQIRLEERKPASKPVNLYGKYAEPKPGPEPKSIPFPAVVILYPEGPLAPAKRGTAPVMDQKDMTFQPHVLPIQKGTEVKFTNSDKVFHNVFSLSSTKKFDLGRYPKGDYETVVFDKTGLVNVFCDIHAEMRAFILVVDTPYFVITDEEGKFFLDDLPPGNYGVSVWHEGITNPESVRTISIKKGGTTVLFSGLP